MRLRLPQLKSDVSAEGYALDEIARVMTICVGRGLLNRRGGGKLSVSTEPQEMARQYLLIDLVAVKGHDLVADKAKGVLLVPGHGNAYGLTLSEFADTILLSAGVLGQAWKNNGLVFKDIEFLIRRGWMEQR
jgi:hypothetical protein